MFKRMVKSAVIISVLGVFAGFQSSAWADCRHIDKLRLTTKSGKVDISNRMEQLEVPGVSIALIENFELSCVLNFGVMDKASKRPVDDNTLFQVASISKSFASVGALMQVEKGVFALNDRVNPMLKDWKIPEKRKGQADKITVKQLLNHTAGLNLHGFPGYEPGSDIPTTVQILNGTKPANTDKLFAVKPVGKNFKYSGGGYTVLQLLMEQKLNSDFDTYMDDQVLAPLGMAKSTFKPLPAERLKEAAMGFTDELDEAKGGYRIHPEQAAASLWTTSAELAKFVIDVQKSLKDGSGKLLSKSMAKEMVTPFQGSDAGLGSFIDKMYFAHGGWNEGYSSRYMAHDSAGYGVIVVTNANKPQLVSEILMAVGTQLNWEDF